MEEKEQKVEYVSFNGRVLASAIDSLLSIILIAPVLQIASKFFDLSGGYIEPTTVYMTNDEAVEMIMATLPSFFLQTFVFAAVVIIFWIYRAATPGKMLLNMKIVDAKTHQAPTKMQCFVRYIGYFVSLIPLCLGFVWIYFDKKGQGFHDKMAGTIVIKEPKKQKII